MKTFVFLDLDGTFWMHQVIPASALRAVERARANGNLIFINTGRARSSAMPTLEGIPVDGFCFSAGSEIWLDGRQLFFHPFGTEKTKRIMKWLSDHDIAFGPEGTHQSFGTTEYCDFLQSHFEQNRITDGTLHLHNAAGMTEDDLGKIMKFSICLKEGQNLDELLEQEELEFTPFGVSFGEGLMSGELSDRSLTKATAMEVVRAKVDPTARTLAIGDSENDIPMIKGADVGICMGNGTTAAKEAADWITDTIVNDGLAKAFEKAGLI